LAAISEELFLGTLPERLLSWHIPPKALTIFAVMMVLHAISTLRDMWLMIYLIPVLAGFITVPAMTLVLVLDVWRRGLLSEWWSYSEV
jgi:hypothetical protein